MPRGPAAPRGTRFAVPEHNVVGGVEVFRRQAEDLLDLRDLVGAERAAVRGRSVLHLGRRVADVRTEHDQRRLRLLRDARAQPGFERVEVVRNFTELHDVPAVRVEALRDVVAVGELGRCRRS